MLTREALEQREKELLGCYAQRAANSKGREHPEPECNFRTCFQRDRDRIIHSTAFRRLEYKTQVFINHEGDYYRTRLTHTLEASQIARGLARILKLNEDLTEAIILAHDLGHTPFGHAGESVMNQLMEDCGGFEHNRQSLRVVNFLEERYPNFPGLNLSFEVREGIMKHTAENPSMEAQIVDIADEIAYINHDLDDGLQHGLLDLKMLHDVTLAREALEELETTSPNMPEKIKRHRMISRLIHWLVDDLQKTTYANIQQQKWIVSFSEAMKKKTQEQKKFLFKNMYQHPNVEKMAKESKQVIRDLFQHYQEDQKKFPTKRDVCDYIAGMTDRFALQEHKLLCKSARK